MWTPQTGLTVSTGPAGWGSRLKVGRKEWVMLLWIVIGLVVVLALIAWAGRARGTARSSDPGMNGRVKNASLRNQSRGDFF